MSKRRILAIVLPHLGCELVRQRVLRTSGDGARPSHSPEGPLVVIYDGRREDEATAQLDAVDDTAWRVGIRPGQKVVEASALASRLTVGHVTTAMLDAALGRVAELSLAFGAMASVERYDTVWLDITGAAHLVGGEASLADELGGRIRDLGHSAQIAISDGPQLAQALARWSRWTTAGRGLKTCIVPPGQAKQALAPLPIKALPISLETVSLFFRLGVMTVAELAQLPRAGLSSRLARLSSTQKAKAKIHARSAVEVAAVLDLVAGHDIKPLVPFEPPRGLEERVIFDEGVEQVEALLFVLRGMTSRMATRLSARAEACTRIELDIEYDRSIFALRTGEAREEAPLAPVEHLSIDLPAPLSREGDLLRALRARLESLVLRAPAVGVRLCLPQITQAHRVQMDLSRDVQVSPDALPALLVELSAELGDECVGTLEQVDSHRPEHRSRLVPVVFKKMKSDQRRASLPEPTRLLSEPVPLGRLGDGAVVSVARQLWSVEQTTMTCRLDGVAWWTRDAVSRDYARVWLSAGRDAPSAEAMVFWDPSTGEAFPAGVVGVKATNDNATPRFAELCGRSCFSFLEGASHPEEMVAQADSLGLDAIALCDRDGLYGTARAHAEAKSLFEKQRDHGQSVVCVIVGAELTLEGGTPDEAPGERAWPRLMLLVEDHDGYSNLCRLLTMAHADHEKGDAGISIAEVANHANGLTALVPAVGGDWASDDSLWAPLRDAFGDRLTVATWRHLDGRDAERLEAAEVAHRRYGAPIIATARPLYHHASRKPLADVMHCIRHKTTLDAAGAALGMNAEARVRSASQMYMLFRDRPEWVRATLPVADRCRFTMAELRYRFPSDELCLPGETPDEALRRQVELGCQSRYPQGTPGSVREQIEKELRLIGDLDVAPYFLSVHQIIVLARRRGILCQGRGSAANSAVCFVLGVTAVDPARSNLLFERFLSAERAEPPDIDVDFEHERREEVIQELYEIYGRDRAAMVSEIIAYRGKSAVREVGKVFGLSLDQVDRLSRIVMRYDAAEVNERRVVEQGLDPQDDRLREVVALARSLEGFPRHLSIHVGGFVLSADSLDRIAPIEPARMEARTVVPWDKDDLDTLGFFKVDVLGLGMLTAIRKTLELIHCGPRAKPLRPELEGAAFDPIEALAAIPPEDPVVYDAIGRADTVGVFQIESRAQMAMLPRLRPRCFYDLVIEVAIVRPGPIQGGMVHPYLKRRTGQEPAVAPHRCLDSILERTLGVPLFQEQVMQIAMVGAGYTAGEADQLRRDMAAWKKHGRLERHRSKLLAGFARQGISAEFGQKLYQQVQGFGEYGFPESHAASFALLVYASSWLKVHHQAAFTCSLLNAQPMGFYSASSLVQDAQRHGVVVAPVCIVRSDWHNTLEPDDASKGGLRLRLGFRQIKGIREAAGLEIERARSEAPFADMVDLVRRTGLKKNEVEAFAEAGALEELVPGRREALWHAHAPRVGGLFEGLEVEPRGGARPGEQLALPTLAPSEQLVLDYSRVGLSIADHPMRYIRRRLDPKDAKYVSRAEDLRKLRNGQAVSMAGMVIGRQRPMTASGVTFFSLEDETGVANLIVQPHVFDEHHLVARHAKFMWVKGRLERQGEVVHLLVFQMKRLDYPSAQQLETRSRDFH